MEAGTGTNPAADVATGQDNSGGAAVFKDAPYDPIQIFHEAQGRIDALQQDQYKRNLAAKNKIAADQAKDLNDIPDTKGAFDIDIQREITPAVNGYLKQYGQWLQAGHNPTDPHDPTYTQNHQLQNMIRQGVQTSIQHNSEYQKQIAELSGANADKYDQDASAEALTKWRNLPSSQRAVTPVPTPIQVYDLNAGIDSALKDMPKQTDANAFETKDGKFIYHGTQTYHKDDQINQTADNMWQLPQVKRQVQKQFMQEPEDIAKKYINFDTYRNSSDYSPAPISYEGQLTPDLTKKWDALSPKDKLKYPGGFDGNGNGSYLDENKKLLEQKQLEADKHAFNGMSLDQRKKYANQRDYLKDIIVSKDATQATKGITHGSYYTSIGQGDIDAQDQAKYLSNLVAGVDTNNPDLIKDTIYHWYNPETGVGNGGKDKNGDTIPTQENIIAGFHDKSLGTFSYTIPPVKVKDARGVETEKTPAKIIKADNKIVGVKKIGDQIYMQTTESEMNPNKYPDGIPVKDIGSEVLYPIIHAMPNGNKIWRSTEEYLKSKGVELKGGSWPADASKKVLDLKKNISKLPRPNKGSNQENSWKIPD